MSLISTFFSLLKEKGIKYCAASALNKLSFVIINQRYKYSPPEKIIVLESHNDFDCNTGAFYEYMLRRGINKKYKLVWLLKNKPDRELPENVYAFKYYGFSFRRNCCISRAKYLLCEDAYIKKQRSCQTVVYCTHGGVTFKNVKGLIVVPAYIDHIMSASENYDPLICENYSIEYPNDRMLHIGYPANDLLFSSGKSELKKLGLKESGQCILWMPTFRNSLSGRADSTADEPYGLPLINDEKQMEELNDVLRANDTVLIIKLHPMQDISVIKKIGEYSNIKLLDARSTKEKGVDVYRLMAAADALISDYSSAAYSYLLLNRPIGFVLSDLEDYKLGFSVENYKDFLPGRLIYGLDEFIRFITDTIRGTDGFESERLRLSEWIYKYRDGKACERFAEFLKLEGGE